MKCTQCRQCSSHVIDEDDVFMRSKRDPRLVTHMDRNMWFVTIAYLPIRDIIPSIPNVNRFFNHEVVWHKWAGRLLWKDMAPGAIDSWVFRDWHTSVPSLSVLMRALVDKAPYAHIATLIAGDANPDAVDRYSRPPLYSAAYHNRVDVIRMLLAANADPNIMDHWGWTPLTTACNLGHTEAVSLLLSSNANVNQATKRGVTALHASTFTAQLDCVRMLITARADVTMRNVDGLSALDFARLHNRHDIVRIIESASNQ